MNETVMGHGGVPRHRSGKDAEILWGSVATTLLMLAAAVFYLRPEMVHALPGCIFKGLTGAACPSCGMTRALLALAAGDLLAALRWNPLVAVGAGLAALYIPYAWGVILGWVRPLRTGWLTAPMPPGVRWSIGVILAANWIYLLAVGR